MRKAVSGGAIEGDVLDRRSQRRPDARVPASTRTQRSSRGRPATRGCTRSSRGFGRRPCVFSIRSCSARRRRPTIGREKNATRRAHRRGRGQGALQPVRGPRRRTFHTAISTAGRTMRALRLRERGARGERAGGRGPARLTAANKRAQGGQRREAYPDSRRRSRRRWRQGSASSSGPPTGRDPRRPSAKGREQHRDDADLEEHRQNFM